MSESIEMEDYEKEFIEASLFVKKNPSIFNDEQKLKLYALYKQSTIGNCNVDKPGGIFNWERKSMWDAWKDLESKNILNSKQMYVDYLVNNKPTWSQ
tara:strand:- start:1275 stop:1565 length:291 start_codon:yes stop_codon:yes gene_type:complete